MSSFIPPSGYSNIRSTDKNAPSENNNPLVAALVYNYFDDTLLSTNKDQIIKTGSHSIKLKPFVLDSSGVFMIDGVDVTDNYLTPEGCFKMSAFLNLFFPNGLSYSISYNNVTNAAITFNTQTFESANSKKNKFCLYNYILDCYQHQYGIDRSQLDSRILILLRKEVKAYKSLGNFKGTSITASWDSIIAELCDTDVIAPDTTGKMPPSDYARVPFLVIAKYHSFVLDIDVEIEFHYNVAIEGYKLIHVFTAQPTYNNIM